MYSKQAITGNALLAGSDVFFCGKAKDRYECITAIYRRLVDAGMNCDFNIARLCSDVEPVHGIKNIDGMDYGEYLQHVGKTKCLLDVLQGSSVGFTLRVWEALVYGKKMITTNKEIMNAPFYDARQFQCINSPQDIDVNFIANEFQPAPRYIEELSPLNFLRFLESRLG